MPNNNPGVSNRQLRVRLFRYGHKIEKGKMYSHYDTKTYRLFVCQDENENEPEDESFRSFWIKPVTNEPGFKYNDTLKG